MTSVQCKGQTKSGKPCKRKAGISGYCHQHDRDRESKNETYTDSSEKETEFAIPALSFSERYGFKPVSKTIQIDSMSQELKNSLWNVLDVGYFLRSASNNESAFVFVTCLWLKHFKYLFKDLKRDDLAAIEQLWECFQQLKWNEVYDFFEVALNDLKNPILVNSVNNVLARELSAYRFVGGVFTRITSKQEIEY